MSNGLGDWAGKTAAGIPGVHKKRGRAAHFTGAQPMAGGAELQTVVLERAGPGFPLCPFPTWPRRATRLPHVSTRSSTCCPTCIPFHPLRDLSLLLPCCARQRKLPFRLLQSQIAAARLRRRAVAGARAESAFAFHGSTCIAPGTPRPSKLLFTASLFYSSLHHRHSARTSTSPCIPSTLSAIAAILAGKEMEPKNDDPLSSDFPPIFARDAAN
ncbi:hypothetical protein IQ07DRAFT_597972 [Pyrenochaeta sp. DS3sAY3a]|nr:hypothetical protein IQ07DRAFT_597972 [Pyrenochaeta sp. DS3sAY3a]